MKLSSIRSRILILLIPLLFVVWGIFSAIVYDMTQEELYETHDAQTFQLARVIAQLKGDSISPDYLEDDHVLGEYFIVIRDGDGNDIYRSTDKVKIPQDLRPGAQEFESNDEDWLVWTFPGQKTDQLYIIGVVIDEATELAEQTIITVSVPLALVLVFSIIATVFIVKRGLRPLTTLSESCNSGA